MSKMTVINEDYGDKEYSTIQFVEWLELIGRLADAKSQGTLN